MGALSDDNLGKMQRDSDWESPRFWYEAFNDTYHQIPPRCGWGMTALVPQETYRRCDTLTRELNAMPDRQAAFDLAKVHPWYVENEYNKCAVWTVNPNN
jgi:hypothetical protein